MLVPGIAAPHFEVVPHPGDDDVRDHLEVWDREAWHEQLREIEGSAEHVAERLATQRD